MPIIFAVLISVPAFICNAIWTKALHSEKTWQANYSTLTDFTSDMVHESQIIWYTQLKAAKLTAAIFIIYTVAAFLMGCTYVFVAIRLILVIHEDVAKAKRHIRDEEAAQSMEKEAPRVHVSQIIREALQANQIRSEDEHVRRNSMGQYRRSNSYTSALARKEAEEKKQQQEMIESNAKARNRTIRLLESALLHIYVQAIAITLGTAAIGSISAAFAIIIYGTLEQPNANGGVQYEDHIGKIWLALMYASCIFGGLSIFTVAYKTYEPAWASISVLNRSHQRQEVDHDTTQIRFNDLTKGIAHIRSTFFESAPSSPPDIPIRNYSLPTGRQRAHTIAISSYDTIMEESEFAHKSICGGNTWETEAQQLRHTADDSMTTSSPSSTHKLL